MKNQQRIDELIAKTVDPVQQATLLVLSSIDYALDANTEATQEISADFKVHRVEFAQHVLDEQKILSGVRWAWWAATAMGAAIVVLGSIILTMYAKTIEEDSRQIKINTNRLTQIEAAMTDLARRQQADEERHRASDGRRLGITP